MAHPSTPRPTLASPSRNRDDERTGSLAPGQPTLVVEPLWRTLIGDLLRRRRRALNQRLVETAARAGISPQYLSEVERGTKDPSSEIIAAIAGALDLRMLDIAADLTRTLSRPTHVSHLALVDDVVDQTVISRGRSVEHSVQISVAA